MVLILLAVVMAVQAENRRDPLPSPGMLSICDVVANDPTKLNGKVIRIRGFLQATGEGGWLAEECKTHLVTKGLTWPNSFSIYVDESDENIARSWEGMLTRLRQLHADAERDKIWLTIIGRLETRASMNDEVLETPHGLVRLGFGHMNDSPAEINVISVEDIRIERRRTEKTK